MSKTESGRKAPAERTIDEIAFMFQNCVGIGSASYIRKIALGLFYGENDRTTTPGRRYTIKEQGEIAESVKSAVDSIHRFKNAPSRAQSIKAAIEVMVETRL